MKTPFDAALRLRRRQIDHTRVAIHAETTRLVEIDGASEALREEVARERRLSTEQLAFSNEAFMRRKLSQRAQLTERRVAVSNQLHALRGQVIEAYGSLRVIEGAADDFRAGHLRRQQRAEQRAADDMGAARIARDRIAEGRIGMTGAASSGQPPL